MAAQASFRHPKSVEEIVREARDFDHNREYPLKIALRTARNILSQACSLSFPGVLYLT